MLLYYIKPLLEDENLAKKIGLNAYEHLVRNFKWFDIILKYERLYSTVNGDGGGRRGNGAGVFAGVMVLLTQVGAIMALTGIIQHSISKKDERTQ